MSDLKTWVFKVTTDFGPSSTTDVCPVPGLAGLLGVEKSTSCSGGTDDPRKRPYRGPRLSLRPRSRQVTDWVRLRPSWSRTPGPARTRARTWLFGSHNIHVSTQRRRTNPERRPQEWILKYLSGALRTWDTLSSKLSCLRKPESLSLTTVMVESLPDCHLRYGQTISGTGLPSRISERPPTNNRDNRCIGLKSLSCQRNKFKGYTNDEKRTCLKDP